MIKVTFMTATEGAKKEELTMVKIMDGNYYAVYNTPGKAEATVKKMKQDGRTGVYYSRGRLLQIFHGKNEDEILEIVKKDIENGRKEAEKQTKKKVSIKHLVIDKNG